LEHKLHAQSVAILKVQDLNPLASLAMALLSQTNATGALTENPKHSVITTEVEVLGDEFLAASDEATSSESSESHSDHDTEHSDIQSAEQKLAVEANKDTVSSSPSAQTEAEILTAIKVLHVVETYGAHGDAAWDGLAGYIPLVVKQIRARRPIQLMFTGFGFKSPLAHQKVLGSVPDLGEKLALAHLDGLCSNIAAVYEQGAKMHICSDGLVYNGWSVPVPPMYALLISLRFVRCLRRRRVVVWK
jgi:hypothetical protein